MSGNDLLHLSVVCWLFGGMSSVVWWFLLGSRRYRDARIAALVGGGFLCTSIVLVIGGASSWAEALPPFGMIGLVVLLAATAAWVVLRVQKHGRSRTAGGTALVMLPLTMMLFMLGGFLTPSGEEAASSVQRPNPTPNRGTVLQPGSLPQTPRAAPVQARIEPTRPAPSASLPAAPSPADAGTTATPSATGKAQYESWGPDSYGGTPGRYGNKYYLRFPVGTPVDAMERAVTSEFRKHRSDRVEFPNGNSFEVTEMTLFVYHTLDPFTKAPKVPGADGADRSYVWRKGQELSREFP